MNLIVGFVRLWIVLAVIWAGLMTWWQWPELKAAYDARGWRSFDVEKAKSRLSGDCPDPRTISIYWSDVPDAIVVKRIKSAYVPPGKAWTKENICRSRWSALKEAELRSLLVAKWDVIKVWLLLIFVPLGLLAAVFVVGLWVALGFRGRL